MSNVMDISNQIIHCSCEKFNLQKIHIIHRVEKRVLYRIFFFFKGILSSIKSCFKDLPGETDKKINKKNFTIKDVFIFWTDRESVLSNI